MKHLKAFEDKSDDQLEILKDVFSKNPIRKTHDFYMFIGKPDFKEDENGLYRKSLEIERMIRITPDKESLSSSAGLEMRARFQHGSTLYHIWLPKEIKKEVDRKSSGDMEPWLVELINQNKKTGADAYSKQIHRDAIQRKQDLDDLKKDSSKYNI
jgi:hypothetical protein